MVDLNELEVVEGRLWANMWRTERIVVIDLSSGRVLFYVDCASLEARLPGTRSLEYVFVNPNPNPNLSPNPNPNPIRTQAASSRLVQRLALFHGLACVGQPLDTVGPDPDAMCMCVCGWHGST